MSADVAPQFSARMSVQGVNRSLIADNRVSFALIPAFDPDAALPRLRSRISDDTNLSNVALQKGRVARSDQRAM